MQEGDVGILRLLDAVEVVGSAAAAVAFLLKAVMIIVSEAIHWDVLLDRHGVHGSCCTYQRVVQVGDDDAEVIVR